MYTEGSMKKELEEIVDRAEKRFRRYVKGVLVQERKQTEKYVDTVLQKQQEQTERYVGALKEDFDHKLDVVMEYVKDIPAIKERQEMMFEQMATMMETDILLRESIRGLDKRLQKVEAR